MSRALIVLSLRHAKAVVLVAGILLAVAGWLIPRMAVDVFPELNAPTVVVMSEAGGLAADEVEQYVTVPIEAAVNGMPGMRKLRSSSSLGLSIVWAEFDWGADLWRARQQVAERLSAVEAGLPPGVTPRSPRSPRSPARPCCCRSVRRTAAATRRSCARSPSSN